MKKLLLFVPVLLLLVTVDTAQAQFDIGASYEMRSEVPENGFGIRVEKQIFEKLPLIKLRTRLHFSYFNQEASFSAAGQTFSTDLTTFDYGVALSGGISIGLVEPYAGLGLGAETFDLNADDVNNIGEDNENNIYWNTFIGARATIIPLIKPFVEYRYTNYELSSPDLQDDQNGRIMFGVYLSF